MSRLASKPRGFTLIEVVVALAIVGAVSIAAFGALSADLRAAALTRRNLELEALASERASTLALADLPTLTALPDSLRQGHFAPPFDDVTWTATSVVVPGVAGLFQESVMVESPEGRYTLVTRVFRSSGPTGGAS